VEWLQWWGSEAELSRCREWRRRTLDAVAAAVGECYGDGGAEKWKWRVWLSAGGAGGDVVRWGLALPRGAGHRRRAATVDLHAARGLCSGRPPKIVDSVGLVARGAA